MSWSAKNIQSTCPDMFVSIHQPEWCARGFIGVSGRQFNVRQEHRVKYCAGRTEWPLPAETVDDGVAFRLPYLGKVYCSQTLAHVI